MGVSNQKDDRAERNRSYLRDDLAERNRGYSLGSDQHGHPSGWKRPSTTEPHIGFFFLHNTTEKLRGIYVVRLGATDFNCPDRRHLLPPGRTCRKRCDSNDDCTSAKKSCECDGICGRSCVKLNQKCHHIDQQPFPNGKITITPENQFAAIAGYQCNEGYVLRGNAARVCQGDGTWSGEEPSCHPDRNIETTECEAPAEIANAYHDGPPGQMTFKLGTMLQFKCKSGYTLSRDAVVRAWCVGGGAWVGPNMTCSHAGCPHLSGIDNGWVDIELPSTIGSKATYTCQVGYFIAGVAERVCGPNGEWQGVPPSCEKVTCNAPPKVEHATHDGDPEQTSYPTGKQLMYSCAYGYSGNGHAKAMCRENGEWIGLTLTCSPRNCGFPGDIENGLRKGYAFTYPNKVYYHCHEGYELQGTGFRICQASGFWSDSLPRCEPITCPTLFSPVYGSVNGSGNTYGTVLRFECDNKYKVVGSAERRCQADRSWSGQTARCEEINCGWPEPFYNGYLIGQETTVGHNIFFSCQTRTTFEGRSFQTTCQENGEWSEPPPTCWGQCQVPSIPEAELVGGRELAYVNHRTVIEFRCRDGLVPRDSSNIRCDNGTWSSKPECIPAPCTTSPPHVHNGMRIFVGNDHGFQAKYKCFPGFKLEGMNSSYLTCNYGEWVGGHPHCKEIYCPNPGSLEHGQVYKKVNEGRFIFKPYIRTIGHGYRLEYECDPGYRIVGPGGATCVDGHWQPSLTNPGTKCEPAIHPPFRKLWTPVPNFFYT